MEIRSASVSTAGQSESQRQLGLVGCSATTISTWKYLHTISHSLDTSSKRLHNKKLNQRSGRKMLTTHCSWTTLVWKTQRRSTLQRDECEDKREKYIDKRWSRSSEFCSPAIRLFDWRPFPARQLNAQRLPDKWRRLLLHACSNNLWQNEHLTG